MHYFRYMRNGHYDLKEERKPPKLRGRKYRRTHSSGYQVLYEPNHPLSNKDGYVYEHRFVMHSHIGDNVPGCEICGKACSWEPYFTHIDHIDNDKSNNKIENLRVLCNHCNSSRTKKDYVKLASANVITHNGITMTCADWARQDFVPVAAFTLRQRVRAGWDAEKALTTPSRKRKRE